MTQTTLAVTGNVSLPVAAASSTLSFSFTAEAEGLVAQTQALIQTLPSRSEDEVIAIAHNARTMERCGYVIRGACAQELLSRVAPLQGGRGKKDTQGAGRKAVLAALAAQFGVEARTLADDERIYERFFVADAASFNQEAGGAATTIMRYGGLGRDHFRAALAAADPLQAIRDASTQAQAGECSVRDLRAIVQANKVQAKPARALSGIVTTETQSRGLVFAPDEASVSNPLRVAPTLPSPASDATPERWEEVLGDEVAHLLWTLVARHNAVHPADLLDPAGYMRRLIMQAPREAGTDLLSTAEVALPATEGELSAATSGTPATPSTREDLVFA